MYVSVFNPSTSFSAGSYKAIFRALNGVPPSVDYEQRISFAGADFIFSPSSFDPITGEMMLPFIIERGTLDGNHFSVGMLQLLSVPISQLQFLRLEKDMDILDLVLFLAAGAAFIYLVR